MKGRTLRLVVACVGLPVLVGIAGTLTAQEKDDNVKVRVAWTGQGSYLGVHIRDVDADAVARLGLPQERGVLVTGVADEGPAMDAGLRDDDVIRAWNGDPIESAAQLRRLLRETPPGRSVSLTVFRDGSERALSVVLGERGPFARAGGGEEMARKLRETMEKHRDQLGDLRVRVREAPGVRTFMAFGSRGRLGVAIMTLGDQLGEYFGLGERSGVLVTSVQDESAAAAAGLKAGDVILAIGDEDVADTGDLIHLVGKAEAGPTAVHILRDGQERSVTVELPESQWKSWESKEGELRGFYFAPDGPEVLDFEPHAPEGFHLELLNGLVGIRELPEIGHLETVREGPTVSL